MVVPEEIPVKEQVSTQGNEEEPVEEVPQAQVAVAPPVTFDH